MQSCDGLPVRCALGCTIRRVKVRVLEPAIKRPGAIPMLRAAASTPLDASNATIAASTIYLPNQELDGFGVGKLQVGSISDD